MKGKEKNCKKMKYNKSGTQDSFVTWMEKTAISSYLSQRNFLYEIKSYENFGNS